MEWNLHRLQKVDGDRSEWVLDIIRGSKTSVYQYDPENKQQTVWLFSGENPPGKFMRLRSTSKQMVVVFFAKSCHVASVSLQEGKTVIAMWYINVFPPKVFEAWSAYHSNNSTHSLLHHHDTAATIVKHIEANRIQLVTQIPYSLGLAPCPSVQSSEAAVEGEAVSGHLRCSGLFRGRAL